MSLRMKLLAAFIAVSVITCGLGLEAFLTLRGLSGSIDDLGNNRIPSIESLYVARESGVAIFGQESGLLSTAATEDERQAFYASIEKLKVERAEALQAFGALPMSAEEASLFRESRAAEERWLADQGAFLKAVKTWEKSQSDNDFADASMALLETNDKTFAPAQKLLNQLVRINTEASANASRDALAAAAGSRTFMLVAMALATCMALGLGIALAQNISGALTRIIDAMRASSAQVASASAQVSSASQQMASSATTQAAHLQEVSSSLEEVTSMTTQNAGSARDANETAARASAAASQGDEAIGRMKEAIGKIQQSARETAKIVKAIDEIAFQTNLLALNAAVEAARAGDAGKGFAVVAEEVRNLAQRSAEAARSTADLIEESKRNAEGGVAVSGQVQQMLVEITKGASEVQRLVSEVAQASDQQASGVKQINTAVTQLDRLTQSTAANAEESASASEEMSSQATELDGLVGELVRLVHGRDGAQGEGGGAAAGPEGAESTPRPPTPPAPVPTAP
jgi:methyl-accepting chemotaxis protein